MSRFRTPEAVLVLAFVPLIAAADDASPSPAAAFQSAKLGLYLPWGLSALLGKGDRVMEADKLPVSEYEKLLPRFNPSEFDAETWVKIAKSAGARYLVVAGKPPDGFCMFDTKLTPYNVVESTPFSRDPLKALADACRKHDLGLFVTYSLIDWHHPDYAASRRSDKDKGEWARYVAYYQGQVRELCSQYGTLGGLWFEGANDRPEADWDLSGTFRMVRELQPTALVGVSRRGPLWPGADVRVVGPDVADGASGPPCEVRLSWNRSWSYDAADREAKTPEQIIQALVNAAGRGANLLVVVGPRPDGTLPTEAVERLLAVGKWLDQHATALRGTRPGPIPPRPWGVSTVPARPEGPTTGVVYLHVTNPDPPIALPSAFSAFEARVPGAADPLKTTPAAEGGVVIVLPETARSPIDTVIVLTPKARPR